MAMVALPLPCSQISLPRRRCGRIFASESQQEPEISPESHEEENTRGCRTCGREDVMWGCNGMGRIQGGIAAVPGFGWWPIKAFRPCPAFLESGGRYKRQGQRLDEFAYGRRIDRSVSDKENVPVRIPAPNKSKKKRN